MRGITVEGAADAGLDPDALQRAFGLLAGWTEDGTLPGAAALIARGGQIAGEAYLGQMAQAGGEPVTAGTIWALASITKPVTATAVMLLVERGLFGLDEPLVEFLPEFRQAPASPFDRRAVTVRSVLSHSSGLPGFSEDNLDLRRAGRPLDDFIRSFSRQPLLFAPGTLHLYSNVAIALAAEIVGRALTGTLGQEVANPAVGTYHAFVRDAILAPLGMADSAIPAPPAWAGRIAEVAGTGQEGTAWEMANSAYYRGLGIPWGGLFSRPRDLVRFVDLFLPAAGGVPRMVGANGTPLLSRATVRAMTSIQAAPPDAPPDLAPELRDGFPPIARAAVEWGLGWEIKGAKRRHPTGDLTSPATFGHGGASGTYVWADPDADLACVLLTNRAGRTGWSDERPRQALFANAVMAAVR
jgi:beta-lactamase class C